jgi:hypothetical protein
MPAYFRIEKDRRLVMSTLSGVFTLADGLAHQEKLLKDLDFDPKYSQLVDCVHVTKVAIVPTDVRRLAQRAIFSPDSRRAILVSDDQVFGFARMFVTFREALGETGLRIYRDLDEALYWVLPGNTVS